MRRAAIPASSQQPPPPFRATINPSGSISNDCQAVGVEANSWSGIKSLFR